MSFSAMRLKLLCLCVVLASSASASAADAPERADVIVYGGTPAGIAAAVAASREGATVILVEPSNHLGGMVTGGLGATDYGKADTVGGIAQEYFTRIGKHYGARARAGVTSRVWRRGSSTRCLREAKVTASASSGCARRTRFQGRPGHHRVHHRNRAGSTRAQVHRRHVRGRPAGARGRTLRIDGKRGRITTSRGPACAADTVGAAGVRSGRTGGSSGHP